MEAAPRSQAAKLLARLVCVSFVILSIGALGAACAEASLSLEEYLSSLETLVRRVDEEVQALGEETFGPLDASASVSEQIDTSRRFYPGYLSIVEDFLRDMNDLNPPLGIRDIHKGFMEAGSDLAEALEGIRDGLAEVETQADLDMLFEADFSGPADRLERACFDAQKIADERQIYIDLNCSLE